MEGGWTFRGLAEDAVRRCDVVVQWNKEFLEWHLSDANKWEMLQLESECCAFWVELFVAFLRMSIFVC